MFLDFFFSFAAIIMLFTHTIKTKLKQKLLL